jgi:glycosyltransferase involved in cell wall biosynthesis
MNINVLHLVHRYAIGGAEVVLANLCKHSSKNINNIVCSFSKPDNDFIATHRPQNIISLDKEVGNDTSLIKKISTVINQYNVDIVLAQGWATYIEGLIAAKVTSGRKCKFIYAFHGKTIEDVQQGIPFRRRIAQKLASYFIDKLIAPSREMIEDYLETYAVSAKVAEVIYNGVDIQQFSIKSAFAKHEIGLTDDIFVAGFVGRLDPVKNVVGAIKAFQFFQEKIEKGARLKVKLVLVGDGPERGHLEKFVKENALEDSVIFFGKSNQVAKYLSAMDVFIQPSLYEGHSNTIVEAMAASLPVISTDVGGTIEIIDNGENGFLFSPYDHQAMGKAMLACYSSRSLRARIGVAANKTVVHQFSVERMVREYEKLYVTLLGLE